MNAPEFNLFRRRAGSPTLPQGGPDLAPVPDRSAHRNTVSWVCRMCGCTDYCGCVEGCCWLKKDLCCCCAMQQTGQVHQHLTLKIVYA